MLFWCWQGVFAAADDDKKDKLDIGMPKEIASEHMIEVVAAHKMRALVLDVVQDVRDKLKESIYLCDNEIKGFQGYSFDEDDDFRIDRGLLFCVSENNTPGTIYTRWGVWRFAQHRASIDYDASRFGLWLAISDKIITHKQIELKPYGRPTSLGGERVYVIKKVGDIALQDPFEKLEVKTSQGSRLQAVVSGISKCVKLPASAACSGVSKGLKKIHLLKKEPQPTVVKPYHPSNRYDSLPYTALLRENEIYWLQLCQAYKKLDGARGKMKTAK